MKYRKVKDYTKKKMIKVPPILKLEINLMQIEIVDEKFGHRYSETSFFD